MNNLEVYLPYLSAVVIPALWFVWQRYQALERRLQAVDRELVDINHRAETSRQANQSNHESHEFRLHGLQELISHRTDRFTSELRAVESRLSQDVTEIKNFLDKSTEFKIRDR